MHIIENEQLKVAVQPRGAELDSIFQKEYAIDYLWNGDPQFWPKKSPVLFPIVGSVRDNTYRYKGKSYQLPRHGFTREKEFVVKEQKPDAITLCLQSDEETLKVFPFQFSFCVTYALRGDELHVTYSVTNEGTEEMYFSVGGHPAFNVPLEKGARFEDYELRFSQKETSARWPNTNGLLQKEPQPFFEDTDVLPLSKDLMRPDALQFKDLKSEVITLQSSKGKHGVSVQLAGFPYVCLWSAPDADFVCIEPWHGISDSVDSDQEFSEKEGVIRLDAGASFHASWSARFF